MNNFDNYNLIEILKDGSDLKLCLWILREIINHPTITKDICITINEFLNIKEEFSSAPKNYILYHLLLKYVIPEDINLINEFCNEFNIKL